MIAKKVLISLLIIFAVEKSMAGKAFSVQGNALSKALIEEPIRNGICSDFSSCHDGIQMYREDSNRIYMNMYGQKRYASQL